VRKNLVRVANLFLYFFMHLRKFRRFLLCQIKVHCKIDENPANVCQVTNSRPLIEGLRVTFPPFSDFRGRICWF
jgi:hypothetical protein